MNMDMVYIINDNLTMNPEVYADYNEAKECFIEQLRLVATNTYKGEIPTHILNDIETLEDSLIDKELVDVGEASYEIDDQCFTLYERKLNYLQ